MPELFGYNWRSESKESAKGAVVILTRQDAFALANACSLAANVEPRPSFLTMRDFFVDLDAKMGAQE